MLLLTFHDTVLIVLEDENVERIRQQDPVEIKWGQLPKAVHRPDLVGIVHLGVADVGQLRTLMQEGKIREAFKFATRGFKYQPEKGDHDMGPTSLLDDKADA